MLLCKWIKDAKAHLRPSGLFEWTEGTKEDLIAREFILVQEVMLEWIECATCTFESKRPHLNSRGYDLSG